MPTVANFVEFMDGPCKGDKAAKAELTRVRSNHFITVTRWKGDELHMYELRECNKAYYVNIIKGTD